VQVLYDDTSRSASGMKLVVTLCRVVLYWRRALPEFAVPATCRRIYADETVRQFVLNFPVRRIGIRNTHVVRRFAPCRLDADDILGRSSWVMQAIKV